MYKNHTFVVCAYQRSVYLEECIQYLVNQTVTSKIIIATSTPNEHIEEIAGKYNIEVSVNVGEKGIVQDWNYAYSIAKTKYMTIVHQDDIYCVNYLEEAVDMLDKAAKPLIYFTDYFEIRENDNIYDNRLLKTKRIMLKPLKYKAMQKSRFIRRRILSIGCPICCPSVTFVKDNLPEQIFSVGFRSDEDWEAWEKLSRLDGEFIYNDGKLMGHRIHEESETTLIIGDNQRNKEDFIMFSKFWPRFIAKFLAKIYAKSEESNEL